MPVIRADRKKINPMYLGALINNNIIRLDNILEGVGKITVFLGGEIMKKKKYKYIVSLNY